MVAQKLPLRRAEFRSRAAMDREGLDGWDFPRAEFWLPAGDGGARLEGSRRFQWPAGLDAAGWGSRESEFRPGTSLVAAAKSPAVKSDVQAEYMRYLLCRS